MKKIGIILLLSIVVIINIGAVSDSEHDEMIDLTTLMVDNDVAIEKWQVTIKEQISRKKANDTVKRLENSYFVSTEQDENIIKYTISDVQKNSRLVESFKVIIPKNKEYSAEVMAIVHGDAWDQSIEQAYHTTIRALPDYLFTNEAKKFSCLTTKSNDTINSDYFFDELKRKLNLKHISTQTDKVKDMMTEKIIYGYTPLWNEKILIHDRPMNVHMAIKAKENGEAKLTIGTPILITEY